MGTQSLNLLPFVCMYLSLSLSLSVLMLTPRSTSFVPHFIGFALWELTMLTSLKVSNLLVVHLMAAPTNEVALFQ